jgi:TM2 domain-containing membrane protein YozV
MAFCENCGASVKPGDQFCENCGASLGAAATEPKPPQPVQPAPPAAPAAGQGEKSPVLAAIASLLFSGLGQVYNGSFGKGLLIFFGTLIGSMIFLIPGLIVLIYGIYDAYTTAKKMNEGQVPFVPYQTTHIIAFIVIGIVVMIIYVLVLASLAMAMGGL